VAAPSMPGLKLTITKARCFLFFRISLQRGASLGFLLTGWLYFLAALAAGFLLWWEHRLLSPQDLTRLNHSFFTLNGSVSLVLGAATLLSIWP
jgi:4-hydroxybenzoate polyprenyltransferase